MGDISVPENFSFDYEAIKIKVSDLKRIALLKSDP